MFGRIMICLAILGVILLGGLPAAHALDIVPHFSANMTANPEAMAAFNRAASQWETLFTDPIMVDIAVDLVPYEEGSPYLALASSVELTYPYSVVRPLMQADAAWYPDNLIVNYLPAPTYDAYLPSGFELASNGVDVTKANLKALSYDNYYYNSNSGTLDDLWGPLDGSITFNSNSSWDYDRTDGLSGYDFEGTAAHEMGHTLGFVSNVDEIDWDMEFVDSNTTFLAWASVLDLFRFGDGYYNPNSFEQFRDMPRMLIPGYEAHFDDVLYEFPLSTGKIYGDGYQASHWKDDQISNHYIGIMDPASGPGRVKNIWPTDARALDLMGYDLADLTVEYEYTYNYISGDSYSGRFYADVRTIYPFSPWEVEDEHGRMGRYTYHPVAYYSVPSMPDGAVTIDSYYDKESDTTHTRLKNGQILGRGSWGLGSEKGYILDDSVDEFMFGNVDFGGPVFEADIFRLYYYTHYYNNGDYYTGVLYASPDLWKLDRTMDEEEGRRMFPTIDEHGEQGYYVLQKSPDLVDNPDLNGRITVSEYFDKESGLTYYRRSNGDLLGGGSQGLGSEDGYIIEEGTPQFCFGAINFFGALIYFEADLLLRQKFTYTFANGDSYQGWSIFDDGFLATFNYVAVDEHQVLGYYALVPDELSYVEDPALLGQVIITEYFDHDSGLTYTTRKNGEPLGGGSNFLKSEWGYIVNDTLGDFFFGFQPDSPYMFEANLLGEYSFEYVYADEGDKYAGRVFASLDYGYQEGGIIPMAGGGYYRITGLNFTEEAPLGQVLVDSYFEAQSATLFSGDQIVGVQGPAYLGSESGHLLLADAPAYQFGWVEGQLHQADVYWRYDFTCYYKSGTGDFYSGTFYDHRLYEVGQQIYPFSDEHGEPGYYVVNDREVVPDGNMDGQVTVASYHDVEMDRTFVPTFFFGGDNYLGSEYGYINIADYPENFHPATEHPPGIAKFLFGNYNGVMYEADVKRDKM